MEKYSNFINDGVLRTIGDFASALSSVNNTKIPNLLGFL